MSKLVTVGLILALPVCTMAQRSSRMKTQGTLSSGYWPIEKSRPIIDKTQTIHLNPDLTKLTAGERKAVEKLLAVGQIFQQLYEDQRHLEALSSYQALEQIDKRTGSRAETKNLLTLYRLFQGPIATTLDNKREPFLPVVPTTPGKNVYPWGVTKEELGTTFRLNRSTPQTKEQLLDQRTVVRVARGINLREDIERLNKYPALQTLHPNLLQQLQALETQRQNHQPRNRVPDALVGYYAVPYAVAYADQLMKAYGLLNEAADAVVKDDEEFARYLRNRARDLLSNDYESGDASWVTGKV
jgi:hypothetical protein